MRPIRYILALCLALPTALAAQDITVTPLDDLLPELDSDVFSSQSTTSSRIEAESAAGGELRVLDKLSGEVTNLSLQRGDIAQLGFLSISLIDCRYPADNPSGDAFTYIEVFDRNENAALFAGWMLASAPALNAMDHPRYDVWALRCITS